MSVFLTNDELALFAENGFDNAAVKRTVEAYREQGLSDDDIRGKIDTKLDGWYAEKKSKEPKQESTMESMQRLGDAGARGIPVIGNAYNPLMAGWDATNDYILDKLGAKSIVPQKPDGTPATWRERYDRALAQYEKKQAQDEQNFPMQTLGAGVITSAGLPLGAASNAAKGAKIAEALKIGMPLAAIDAGLRTDGDLLQRAENSAKSAALVGALTPVVGVAGIGLGKAGNAVAKGGNYVKNFAKNSIHTTRNAVDKITRGALSPSAEDMAVGAQNIAGAMPDNGELTGTAVKNLTDDITKAVKAKAAALYDEAEQLAAGGKVVLDKNSNFAKAFTKLSENATKSGRTELNKVWEEVGHSTYDAPTYETAKSFRSWLSEKSASGGTGLNKKQYGDLLEALDKDIEASLGKEASAAKKAADAFYRNEMGNPDSITNSVNKLVRNDPVSVVGNRAVASAQGRAWKASPLQKVLQRGEEMGSPYVQDVKQGLQANTVTRAQFNRMSPAQKQMVYGDKLEAAEKNFNGGLLNWLEQAASKGIDNASLPMQRLMEALQGASTRTLQPNNVLRQTGVINEQLLNQ